MLGIPAGFVQESFTEALTVAAPGRPFSSSWVACKAIRYSLIVAPVRGSEREGKKHRLPSQYATRTVTQGDFEPAELMQRASQLLSRQAVALRDHMDKIVEQLPAALSLKYWE